MYYNLYTIYEYLRDLENIFLYGVSRGYNPGVFFYSGIISKIPGSRNFIVLSIANV